MFANAGHSQTPDRYEVSPRGYGRLPGNQKERGTRLGFSTWGGFIFGSAFVAAGFFVIFLGTNFLHPNPGPARGLLWVVAVAGASFAGGGIWVWSMAWAQLASNRRREKAATEYKNEPALADYHWHPDGFDVSEWALLVKLFSLALALTIFLSIFNWWAFVLGGSWVIKAIVCLFDYIALGMWWEAALQLARALKFGHSRIEFESFPFHSAGPVALRWRPRRGIRHVNKGTFTLRYVEEWIESRREPGSRSGADRVLIVVHREIWSATWLFEQPRNLQPGDGVELRYELPPFAGLTNLGADKPFFWELEVKLDLPGLDFNGTYLVPVYGKV
jgi:hypothetical protein